MKTKRSPFAKDCAYSYCDVNEAIKQNLIHSLCWCFLSETKEGFCLGIMHVFVVNCFITLKVLYNYAVMDTGKAGSFGLKYIHFFPFEIRSANRPLAILYSIYTISNFASSYNRGK